MSGVDRRQAMTDPSGTVAEMSSQLTRPASSASTTSPATVHVTQLDAPNAVRPRPHVRGVGHGVDEREHLVRQPFHSHSDGRTSPRPSPRSFPTMSRSPRSTRDRADGPAPGLPGLRHPASPGHRADHCRGQTTRPAPRRCAGAGEDARVGIGRLPPGARRAPGRRGPGPSRPGPRGGGGAALAVARQATWAAAHCQYAAQPTPDRPDGAIIATTAADRWIGEPVRALELTP